MIRVCIYDMSKGPADTEERVLEMPAVPREGESLAFDMNMTPLKVRTVIFTPLHQDYDVQIRAW